MEKPLGSRLSTVWVGLGAVVSCFSFARMFLNVREVVKTSGGP